MVIEMFYYIRKNILTLKADLTKSSFGHILKCKWNANTCKLFSTFLYIFHPIK